MRTSLRLGTVANLSLSAAPSALLGSIVLWLALTGIAIGLLRFATGVAIVSALIAVALHWLGETIHQLGHARAAQQTGYPMRGIRYWGLLSTSIYPSDEPALPAELHIQRASGGPLMSANVVIVAAIILLLLRLSYATGAVWWLGIFFLVENLLVFTLGTLLPLGFTDGSTLLHWRNKK
jgi:type III secretory pathway component EscS